MQKLGITKLFVLYSLIQVNWSMNMLKQWFLHCWNRLTIARERSIDSCVLIVQVMSWYALVVRKGGLHKKSWTVGWSMNLYRGQ